MHNILLLFLLKKIYLLFKRSIFETLLSATSNILAFLWHGSLGCQLSWRKKNCTKSCNDKKSSNEFVTGEISRPEWREQPFGLSFPSGAALLIQIENMQSMLKERPQDRLHPCISSATYTGLVVSSVHSKVCMCATLHTKIYSMLKADSKWEGKKRFGKLVAGGIYHMLIVSLEPEL